MPAVPDRRSAARRSRALAPAQAGLAAHARRAGATRGRPARRRSIVSFRFVTQPEIRREARRILPLEVWNFGDGASETELTKKRNRQALDRLAIRQDILVDAREIDTATTLCGVPLSWPVVIAPMGGLVLFHEEGDVEMGRGAERADTLQFLSGATGWPVETVAAASKGPKMFQLYHFGDRAWVAELLARVEASGYLSVCLTVDTQVYSRRERDVLARWSPREAMKKAPNPRGPAPDYPTRLTWSDVEWLQKTTRLPVGLKGVMTATDAKRAVDMGVRIVWVSNHGGRQLDSTQASIDALPAIADAVGDRADIIIDGGFSRGTAVLKGIAWGARADEHQASDVGLRVPRRLELSEIRDEVRRCPPAWGAARRADTAGCP
ncbi:MAG: alpha-hydroxy-acid oxidizing enzyme [Candidatus Rokuibacteriota bacterium]|nr:MAG: alpha-hydroxy-acid oxidizing enzyme [Candidatus Rokubacteria bacterium]